jgi:hypothetical protein
MLTDAVKFGKFVGRRSSIGGSDPRIIMSSDEPALIRLWREKRGEPEGLSGNLIVRLGASTEDIKRVWFERNSGRQVRDMQRRVKHSAIPWMAAPSTALWKGPRPCSRQVLGHPKSRPPKSPWPSSSTAYGSTHLRTSVLSIITGGGKWVEITIPMPPRAA